MNDSEVALEFNVGSLSIEYLERFPAEDILIRDGISSKDFVIDLFSLTFVRFNSVKYVDLNVSSILMLFRREEESGRAYNVIYFCLHFLMILLLIEYP